jgi:hypothetical protein
MSETKVETSRTPGPWRVGESTGYGIEIRTSTPFNANVAMAIPWKDGQGKANAAFIVRACNAYDDMLAALEAAYVALLGGLPEDESKWPECVFNRKAIFAARAAIRKATGQGPNGTE